MDGARRRTLSRAIGLLALLAALAGPAAAGTDTHPFFRGLKPPLVVAHRGGGALAPENTLDAFRTAMARGADVLEMDLHVTADDVLVVIHDPTVDRTTNGSGDVRALTLERLKALDAGYRWSPDDERTFPYRGRGLTVPTLTEVLDGLPAAHLAVEIKPGATAFAAAACRAITAAGARDRVLMSSVETAALAQFRRECPGVATSASGDEAGRFVTASSLPLVSPTRPPANVLQLPERWRGFAVLTPRVVRAAHAAGLQVHAFTINDEADMRRLLAMNVDGIITDYPDRMVALLGRARAARVSD